MSRSNIHPVVRVKRDEDIRIRPIYHELNRNKLLVDPILEVPVFVGTSMVGNSYPLIMGEEFDLLGISQFKQLMDAKQVSIGSTIDQRLMLENLYISLGDQLFQFPIQCCPRAAFLPSIDSDTRTKILDFKVTTLTLDANSFDINGNPIAFKEFLELAGGWIEIMAVVRGRCDISRGPTMVVADQVSTLNVNNTKYSGEADDLYAKVIRKIAGEPKVIAYDLEAYFTRH